MHWAEAPIHFIDFEGNAASGILEFGVVTLRGGEIAAVRTRLCAATGRVVAEDTAVHGLRADMVTGQAPFKDEWEYFAGLRETGPLAAHFAPAENYLLQVGSFQNPADADNLKARLALLGMEAGVEPINLAEKGTWYRVRLGPYIKVDEINRLRQTLAQNGIEATLVKVKDSAPQ